MLFLIVSCVAYLAMIDEVQSEGTDFGGSPASATPDASEQGFMLTRYVVGMEVRSGAVADDGEAFYGGIGGGTVCTFDGDGVMVADSSVSESAVMQGSRGELALAATAEGLEVLDTRNQAVKDWAIPGVREGALRDRGAVALSDTALTWVNGAGVEATMPLGGCRGLSVDRAADVAWLACGGSLVAYEPDDARPLPLEGGAYRAVWSPGLDGLFVVSQDGSTLEGVTAEGEVLWSTPLDAPVLGLVAVGGTDAAALLLAGPDTNEVRLVEGVTGAFVDRLPTDATGIGAAYEQPVVELNGGLTSVVLDVELSG